jgi:hypothetical protein
MMNHNDLTLSKLERRRGWIIYLIYKARPHPVELAVLSTLLDAKNFPMSRRLLAEELDYLRSLRILRVFYIGANEELSEVQQAKLIQRYAECESDEETGKSLCVRLTAAGINYQDGIEDFKGIHRVK